MMFYILSLKYSKIDEPLVWWRPDNRGYTNDLSRAGKYTEEDVRKKSGYYDNKESTLAVPVELADSWIRPIIMPSCENMKAFGSGIHELQDSELGKARDQAEELAEYAWHNSPSACDCEVCKKLDEQMENAMNGG